MNNTLSESAESNLKSQHSILKELTEYKYALDQAAIVAITTHLGEITYVNDNFCSLSGYSEAELIGQDHRIVNSGYHSKQFIKELWTAIENGEVWKGEIKNRAKDGHFYWVDTTIVPFLNNNGKPFQYLAIRFDITERKRTEQAVRERKRFIRNITDNIPAMIGYWSADLKCLFANNAYRSWFNKTEEEMDGAAMEDLISDAEIEVLKPRIISVLQGEAQSFERVLKGPEKSEIISHTQYVPDVSDGKVVGFYSLVFDMTELKLALEESVSKTKEIASILDRITDGFIALDQNQCCIYVNRQFERMVGKKANELIGKNLWDVFPLAVGSSSYNGIQQVLSTQTYIEVEDYYPPLNLWQENRIYPSGNGLALFVRDISKRKEEEHRLKLMESVITNTKDGVVITYSESAPGKLPVVVYVNEAFCAMTGYTEQEIIGKTPSILHGPKTDKEELNRIIECINGKRSCEATLLNYKKDGQSFWVDFSVSPVKNTEGKHTHWIAIQRDVTRRKQEEMRESLLSEISKVFSVEDSLNVILANVLHKLVLFGDFKFAELWLVSADKTKINLNAKFATSYVANKFYSIESIKSFDSGIGLPGTVWQNNEPVFWSDIDTRPDFLRREGARQAGIKSGYGVPLIYNGITIGVLLIGLSENNIPDANFTSLLRSISPHLGDEIHRKQIEQELNQVFSFAPDMIVSIGIDGYFKKVNPAALKLFEYAEEELLSIPIMSLVLQDDHQATLKQLQGNQDGNPISYFENRMMNKSGKLKWLAWTATPASEEGLIFCVAKDITEQKMHSEQFKEISWIQSHLVRAPLARIMAITSLMKGGDLTNDEFEQLLNHMETSANELDGMITKINTISYDASNISKQMKD